MSVQFIREMVEPYKGTTFSGINDGMELTYDERLQRGKRELNSFLENGEEFLRNMVIQSPDFIYDDCYRSYYGIIVVNIDKDTGDITWWLRDD